MIFMILQRFEAAHAVLPVQLSGKPQAGELGLARYKNARTERRFPCSGVFAAIFYLLS
ncbi:MAG: hypothetical protein ACI9PY_000384 [Ascidiaceihabitans sp.]|jgi:hypothetical protein